MPYESEADEAARLQNWPCRRSEAGYDKEYELVACSPAPLLAIYPVTVFGELPLKKTKPKKNKHEDFFVFVF